MRRRQRDLPGAALGQRLQLTIGTNGELLGDRRRDDALAFAGLDDVIAEAAQFGRQRRTWQRSGQTGTKLRYSMTRNGRSSAGVKVKLVTLQSGTDDPGVVPQPSV